MFDSVKTAVTTAAKNTKTAVTTAAKNTKTAVTTAAKNTKTLGLSVGTGLMVYGGQALAAPPAAPDVADGVAFIESLLVPIGLLGAAFLIVGIAIKGWKIMRSV